MHTRTEMVAGIINGSPVFPPSFDNNPFLFGAALFASVLIVLLGSATIVRIASRTMAEHLPSDHPVYQYRMMVACLLVAAVMGRGSDVLTWVMWGEVSAKEMGVVLLVSKILDAGTMFPFMMGLFVPYWVRFLRRRGLLRAAGLYEIKGGPTDMRITWGQVAVPFNLVGLAAIGSAGVALSKWALWYGAHVAQ